MDKLSKGDSKTTAKEKCKAITWKLSSLDED